MGAADLFKRELSIAPQREKRNLHRCTKTEQDEHARKMMIAVSAQKMRTSENSRLRATCFLFSTPMPMSSEHIGIYLVSPIRSQKPNYFTVSCTPSPLVQLLCFRCAHAISFSFGIEYSLTIYFTSFSLLMSADRSIVALGAGLVTLAAAGAYYAFGTLICS